MLPVHCYCCLLKRLKLWLRLKLRLWLRLKLWLVLHSAQKQGKRGEGFTCSNSHTKGQTQRGPQRRRLVGAACTGAPQASSAQPRPLPFASSLQLLELPLPLQLHTAPLLSSQPFSWGLRLQEQGQGVHPVKARLELILKPPSTPLLVINLSLQIQFGEGPEDY